MPPTIVISRLLHRSVQNSNQNRVAAFIAVLFFGLFAQAFRADELGAGVDKGHGKPGQIYFLDPILYKG